MTQEEFDRIKEEEKQHLRQLRDLKRTYRQAQQKKSLVDSLTGMTDALGNATSREEVNQLMREAAFQEARLELALEGEEKESETQVVKEEDLEATQKAEAASLLNQIKHELGEKPASNEEDEHTSLPETNDTAPAPKTLGRPRNG